MQSKDWLKAFTVVQVFLLMTFVPAARAQAVYGSIFGTVTDNSGAVVPNATITVTDVAKGTTVTAQTSGDGQYRGWLCGAEILDPIDAAGTGSRVGQCGCGGA